MIERCQDLRFELKPGEPLRVCGDAGRQSLDRDFPVQLRVAGAINLAHAPTANQREDFEGAEALAGPQRHLRITGLYGVGARSLRLLTLWSNGGHTATI
jgi:hypothetical protein